MTTLDWVILAATLLFAIRATCAASSSGALSLARLRVGAIVGTRVADALLASGAASPYAPVFGLVGALGAGAILAFGLEGVGMRLRRGLRLPFWACSTGSSARSSARASRSASRGSWGYRRARVAGSDVARAPSAARRSCASSTS